MKSKVLYLFDPNRQQAPALNSFLTNAPALGFNVGVSIDASNKPKNSISVGDYEISIEIVEVLSIIPVEGNTNIGPLSENFFMGPAGEALLNYYFNQAQLSVSEGFGTQYSDFSTNSFPTTSDFIKVFLQLFARQYGDTDKELCNKLETIACKAFSKNRQSKNVISQFDKYPSAYLWMKEALQVYEGGAD